MMDYWCIAFPSGETKIVKGIYEETQVFFDKDVSFLFILNDNY